ncbi:hypothetical protein U472_09710 [Orenia metallireducens]|uniref:Yip1 domain-containing protein n=1 Tax=Orenia metallireducens TaxID=1413210 RepID=A0A1C0A7R3_9FIRM|nr:YIP1 family protein [Orenia metallireducens]OCL26277.1 hypothetical protein U472_09710 [Orenia metallireducens]
MLSLHYYYKVLFNPRVVIKTNISSKFILVLASITGIFDTVSRGARNNGGIYLKGEPLYFYMLMLGGIILMGIIFGIIKLYISAGMIKFFGDLLGGKASFKDIKKALGLSYYPYIIPVFLLIPRLLIFKHETFMSNPVSIQTNLIMLILYSVFLLIDIISVIWGLVILVKAISEIQNFSVIRSFFNVVLPVVSIVGLIMLIAIPLILV